MPKGGWIITLTGKHVYPLDFTPDMIDLEDIAHALSNLCRFTGHTRKFYSVAEHCVHVAYTLYKRGDNDLLLPLQGLLHDASEAYMNDLAQPIKRMPQLEVYTAAERQVERTILDYFGIPISGYGALVKQVDLQMLHYEGVCFFGSIEDWDESIKLAGLPNPRPTIHHWSPPQAKQRFLDLFTHLWVSLQAEGNDRPSILCSGEVWPR